MGNTARPVLKWAGGKRQLLGVIDEHLPSEVKNGEVTKFVEPMVGGGAVFFHMKEKYGTTITDYFISDYNWDLFIVYRVIQARVKDLISELEILANEYRNAEFTCVMHCFSSGRELAKKMLDLGFFLSMSGIITFPKSDELRDIFSLAPLDQILVETDSPYLAPPPYRGKGNQPAYVTLTAKKGAELFNLSYEQFAEQLERNFDKLFVKAVNFRPNT